MADITNTRSPHEQQLDALIAKYYEAVELGQSVDQADFLRQHPEFAAELREFFADLGQLEKVAPPLAPELEETQLFSNSTTALKQGTVVRYFGGYEILEVLGAGGMGVVYKVRQVKLKKIVALKMIKVGQFASEDEVRRFQAEARAAAKLDHPGIVAVHEVGIHERQHYYEMDFVGGGSLSKLHRDEPVAARRAAELVQQLAEAMQYAHGQGIIHRDLKPANVLLTTGGVPRITDFGLAKRLWSDDETAEAMMTETGQVLGTAGYMSPEQAAGKTRLVGPPTDIYALGAILYALLTSRAPFLGESQADTIMQVIQREPVSPRTLNPSVPRDLETICLKCLEKEPHGRYGTAQLLADDLTRFLEGRPVIARPISRPARAWRWCRRNPWVAGLTSLLLLAIVIGSGTSAWMAYRESAINVELMTTIGERDDANKKLGTKLTENQVLNEDLRKAVDEERWQVYRLRLMKMEQHWRNKEWGQLERMLAESVPAAGEKEIRGWEWYFLQAQVDRRTWRTHYSSEGNNVAFDWDRHTGQLAALQPGKIEIWLPSERRLIKTIDIPGINGGGDKACWSPDHRHLAVGHWLKNGGKDNVKVHVVDTETGVVRCTIIDPGPQRQKGNYIQGITWSPRGDYLAVNRAHEQTCIWKIDLQPESVKTELVKTFDDYLAYRIRWSDDQVRCVTTSQRGEMHFWNTADWTRTRSIKIAADNDYLEVAWSPNGERVAFAANPIVIADADGSHAREIAGQGRTIRVCWLDNEQLVTANDEQELRVHQVDQHRSEVFKLHSNPIKRIVVGPNGKIASSALGEPIRVWSTDEISPEYVSLSGARLPPQVFACDWHYAKNLLALVSPQGGINVAAIWSPGETQATPLMAPKNVQGVRWNPAGDAIICETSAGSWQTVAWPRTASTMPAAILERKGSMHEISADGRYRIEGKLLTAEIRIIDTSDVIAPIDPIVDNVYAFAWHPREPLLALAKNKMIRLIDPLRDPTAWTGTYSDKLQTIDCLAWNPDGRYLLAGGTASTIHVMDGATMRELHVLRGHAGKVTALGWHPDGTRIVSASVDGSLRWWDVERGIELFKIPTEKSDVVRELRFSADGTYLAGRTDAGKVHIWSAQPHFAPPSIAVPSPYTGPKDYEILRRPLNVLDEAVAANPNSANAYRERAAAYTATEQWELANADWLRVVALQPSQFPKAFDTFRNAERWSEAAGFGEKWIETRPEDSSLWLKQAPVLVLAKDAEAYRAFCNRIVMKFGKTTDLESAVRLVKACLLQPGMVDVAQLPADAFVKPLDDGTTPTQFQHWRWGLRGLLALRSGDAELAVKYIGQSQDLKPIDFSQAFNLPVLALAQHQLQHPDKARAALEDATQLIALLKADPLKKYDQNVLIAEILLREAEAKINGKAKPKPSSVKPDSAPAADKSSSNRYGHSLLSITA